MGWGVVMGAVTAISVAGRQLCGSSWAKVAMLERRQPLEVDLEVGPGIVSVEFG